jgi:hypothetical protein
MVSRPLSLRKGFAACLIVVAGCGGLYSLALLVEAVTGRGFIGSVMLFVFGTALLIFSAVALVFGLKYWKSSDRE